MAQTDSATTEVQEALQKQAERDRLMAAIALRIHQSLDLQEILDCTVAEVRQFLQVDRVLIYRFDPNSTGTLVAAAVAPEWNLQEALETHQTWQLVEQNLYQQGQSYTFNNVEQSEFSAEHRKFLGMLKIKAKIVVPIFQGAEFWGVLVIHQCTNTRQWQRFETDFLGQVATQMAIAIQQAQLFNQVQQQAQREQLLNQISRALNSSLDLDHILQEIVDRTGECFSVDRVLIFTISDKILARNEWRNGSNVVSLLAVEVALADWTDLADPNSDFYQHRVFHAPDFSQLPPTPSRRIQIEQAQVKSVLAVPIFIRDKLFGELALHTTTCYRTFTHEEIQLLQRIGDQAAIALYNAQSYERLEDLVQERTRELQQEKLISEAANRSKTEFLATMSHELRTPLNAILGLSQILQQQIFGSLTPKQAEYVSHIHSSGEHLLLLINDILDLAKVDAGRETLTLAAVILPDLCRYCLTLVQEQAFDRGLQLTCDIAPEIDLCFADERRLKQMLLNLLSNAIKFTPQGQVSLIVKAVEQGITFTVADTGIGIAAEQLGKLFQPFSQVDSQFNRQYNGTGLGLALTRKLARLHQGDVTVKSTLGKGSEFTIYIPNLSLERSQGDRCDTQNASDIEVVSPRSNLTRKILIIENDERDAMLLQDYLQTIGYQVEHLFSGQNLLETVRCFRPKLILLDAQLSSEETSLDLLDCLKQQVDLCQIPVVMMTAVAVMDDREKFLAAGADDCLSKPLEIVKLELLLMKYL